MEIKTIENFEALTVNIDPIFVCDVKPVRQLEADYKEAIKALEGLVKENIFNDMCTGLLEDEAEVFVRDEIEVIEKAYGESWKKIRGKNGD